MVTIVLIPVAEAEMPGMRSESPWIGHPLHPLSTDYIPTSGGVLFIKRLQLYQPRPKSWGMQDISVNAWVKSFGACPLDSFF